MESGQYEHTLYDSVTSTVPSTKHLSSFHLIESRTTHPAEIDTASKSQANV